MPERPLLILPAPGEPANRSNRSGGGGRLHFPSRARQRERLAPRFAVLEQALEARRLRLQVETVGITPEEVIVLETVEPVQDFIVAVRAIEGLEWLGEIEEEDIPPDDDFFVVNSENERQAAKTLRGRVFLILTNQRALRELLSLWNLWNADNALPRGLGRWGYVFERLRDVRPWGVQDRLMETGVLDDWHERITYNDEVVPCEIELWFRTDPQRRRTARDRVTQIVQNLNGQILQEATIEEIAYQAILVRLPVGAISPLFEEAGRDTALVQCEQIQFFRAAGQMTDIVEEEEQVEDTLHISPPTSPLGKPVVALFDGLPLQNHQRLAGRLIIDDPDGHEALYPASERRHGTAMASLILHGDLDSGDSAVSRYLYVRPILRPAPQTWRQPQEMVPEEKLVVDLIHRAVLRLFEPDVNSTAVAPEICVVNLSIGIKDRLFDGALSPLARLLDWLAWKYRLLFLVSAGNHTQDIELTKTREEATNLSPQDLQAEILRAVARDTRNRRLLSPAEAINALTIGAIHSDASNNSTSSNTVPPFVGQVLPSPINAQGMGYRRSIKPEIFLPGGRVVFQWRPNGTQKARLQVSPYQASRPGQRVAAPGPTPGELTHTWHTRGTSNATALASRTTSQIYDVLDELRSEPEGHLIDNVPRSVWLKVLLVHSATWGPAGELLRTVLLTPQNSRQFKEYLTRLLGYGQIESSRVRECTEFRVTALSGGHLQCDQAHIHRFPLPSTLSGRQGWRRLTLTLAWLTPVNTSHQAWRRADLWFTPSHPLQLVRQGADSRATQRGTVQHEVLEGDRAAVYVDGDNLEIQVSCRAHAGALEDLIPYALATTLEVAPEIGVPIYDEIRSRVLEEVRIAPQL